jgi:hypothetical protein
MSSRNRYWLSRRGGRRTSGRRPLGTFEVMFARFAPAISQQPLTRVRCQDRSPRYGCEALKSFRGQSSWITARRSVSLSTRRTSTAEPASTCEVLRRGVLGSGGAVRRNQPVDGRGGVAAPGVLPHDCGASESGCRRLLREWRPVEVWRSSWRSLERRPVDWVSSAARDGCPCCSSRRRWSSRSPPTAPSTTAAGDT